ncbi:3-deoxy-7-phosphoheptulonate synthase [Hujiaoplasma nucleasis]|uniref:3-deoxy-7-phosphoheptulonate synthase n=1 Tax=Hujiaoplasma nucleasis TaxID=2725268 RepID=A0A7L6N5C6_9MOLU|nr:3-deoxy-7-phosphoheptulonate synthase [Hujiaoplasma nucleasis]QLY40448.1 3-deoxy-7-phosphoheptulonate synthase [Hujiaoplasma nucleasis]
MIVKFKKNVKDIQIKHLQDVLNHQNYKTTFIDGDIYKLLVVIGDTSSLETKRLTVYDFVEDVINIQKPYKESLKQEKRKVNVGNVTFNDDNIVLIAGPCSIENDQSLDLLSSQLVKHHTHIIRGGAFKPRTSPYSFQGIGEKGLHILKEINRKYKVPVISEITDVRDIDLFVKYVDIIQVGARNMQNYVLLEELGKINKPILLKRGFVNTIEELLLSAEYILANGNKDVILCERGIRTFENQTRNTLDISAVPVLKKLTNLPVIVDPSHAAGHWEYIESLSLAAIAAGADGLMIEVHENPEFALSDGQQSLKPEKYFNLVEKIKKIAIAIDKKI